MLDLFESMRDADFVVIDGEIFKARYLRIPDETTVADDIVVEAEYKDIEIALTRFDIEQAIPLDAGFFKLKNGMVVRFLPAATIH